MSSTASPPRAVRLALVALAAWVVLVVGVYYRRAWALALGGPSAWVPDGEWYALVPTLGAWGLALGVAAVVVTLLQRAAPGRTGQAQRWRVTPLAALGALVAAALLAAAWPRPLAGRILPWLGEAATRNLRGVAAAAIVVLAAYVAGALLLGLLKWRGSHWADRLLFRAAAGFAALSYLWLALCALGWYRPRVVVATLTALLLGGALWLARGTALGRRVPPKSHPEPSPSTHRRPGRTVPLAWIVVTTIAMVLALVSALAPEIEYDSLWYHLQLPAVYLQHGTLVDVPHEFVSLYPMTWELLFGAGLVLGGPVGAKLLHFACLPLVALAVWRFAGRFLPHASPWLAVAVAVTVPTVLWEATTAYIDLALALYATLGLYSLLVYLESGDKQSLTLAIASFGIGAALKHLGLVIVAIVSLGLFVQLWRSTSFKRAALVTAALVGGSLVFAVPWYVRSWLLSGNPFFPEMFALFGASPERWDAVAERGLAGFKARLGFPRTPLNLLILPWNMTMYQARCAGALGPIFLAALPLMAWRARATAASGWLAYLVVFYLAIWASPISSYQVRFLVPIVPALALLSAEGIGALLESVPRSVHAAATAALVVLLLANLPPFIPLHEGDREGRDGWLTHVVREVPLRVVAGREPEDEYLRARVATYGAWVHAARLPP
ncbi:MAG: hypothetical protein KBA95_16715, partial [Acidobacteria bacterium]|nr:hypothetical protein [Acidobacteriota bacterium]